MLWPFSIDDNNWQSMVHTLEIYITMLWPLSLDDNNWQSMVHILGMYYHAPLVVMRW